MVATDWVALTAGAVLAGGLLVQGLAGVVGATLEARLSGAADTLAAGPAPERGGRDARETGVSIRREPE